MKVRFFFKNMHIKVHDFMQCQKSKTTRHVISPIAAISMSNQQIERINVDIAGPFPSFKGNLLVLICVDPFTGWIEAFSIQDQTTSSVIQTLNFHVQYFGAPSEIHLDLGYQFTSHLFQEFCKFSGTNHRNSSDRYLK